MSSAAILKVLNTLVGFCFYMFLLYFLFWLLYFLETIKGVQMGYDDYFYIVLSVLLIDTLSFKDFKLLLSVINEYFNNI